MYFLLEQLRQDMENKVAGFTVFDNLDSALIYFDSQIRSYGISVVKPVITVYTFGVPGGRKVLKSERVIAQRRLGLKEI